MWSLQRGSVVQVVCMKVTRRFLGSRGASEEPESEFINEGVTVVRGVVGVLAHVHHLWCPYSDVEWEQWDLCVVCSAVLCDHCLRLRGQSTRTLWVWE